VPNLGIRIVQTSKKPKTSFASIPYLEETQKYVRDLNQKFTLPYLAYCIPALGGGGFLVVISYHLLSRVIY
jgi:hypothetical protein